MIPFHTITPIYVSLTKKHYIFKVSYLRRRKLGIANHKGSLLAATKVCKLLYLSASEIGAHVGVVLILYHSDNDLTACGVEQSFKLVKGRLALVYRIFIGDDRYYRRPFNVYFFVNFQGIAPSKALMQKGDRTGSSVSFPYTVTARGEVFSFPYYFPAA